MSRALLILLLTLSGSTTALNAQGVIDADGETTRILVTFADPGMSNAARAGAPGPGYRRGTSSYLVSVGVKRAARRVAEDFNLVTVDEWPIVTLKVHCLVFAAPGEEDIDALLARLRERPEVDSAQRLNEFEVSARSEQEVADPYANLQHNLVTLELPQAHHWSTGDGTEVSIIDTGADFDHPELRGRIASYHDFVEDDGQSFADAHGTAVAGVIGADSHNGVGIVGVAPSARLSILKACWHRDDRPRAVCNSFTLAKALNHAIESAADIVNLSLNGPSDGLLGRLVERALGSGIIVVAAAPQEPQTGFPVDVPGVIVVGADDQDDAMPSHPFPAIRAPGDEILVPVPDGGYDFASGTSLSAAQVSGIVALMVARRPGLTASEAQALLESSQADGHGPVNACRALARLLTETGCQSSGATSASH
ncbi:MAG: S8 family serine peptidase [Xanthomonadales bacterium]|nr:S8 family serine peptidase [Xanthomonadales bacterium]